MHRLVSLLLIAVLLCGLWPGAANAQTTAIVTAEAPIYLKPEANRTPLRTAARGTRLRVVAEQPDWLQVEFNDPQLGLRVGWIRRELVDWQSPETTPMDLSVPATRAPAVPAAAAESPAPQKTVSETGRAEVDRLSSGTPARGPMRPGYKWTGIALLIAGGATILTGALGAEDACYDTYGYDEDFCKGVKYTWIGLGAAAAGTGVLLLGIGNAKREPVAVSLRGDRVLLTMGF